MNNEHETLIKKKAQYHLNSTVHITLKNNFYENGVIESIGESHLILKLSKKGRVFHNKDHKTFFFLEIEDIDDYHWGGGE